MDRNYDEIISDILIQLDTIERRMTKSNTRMDLTIKRIVMLENRIDMLTKKQDHSIIALQEFIAMQSKLNRYFLEYMERNPIK
jgi:hypothetical protein